MYCPQCGQVQSDEMRYCSRCGLSLNEVSLWLSGASELLNPQASSKELSRRRKNILRAAKVAFFSGVLFPVGLYFSEMSREAQWVAIPLVVFFGSLMWMLYCRLFMAGEKETSRQQHRMRAAETSYLPPGKSTPQLESHRINTAEMVQPGSVTEYTTNLLRK
jgi:hypothetical protein